MNSFNTCIQILRIERILQYPDFNKEIIPTSDASDVSLGTILSQRILGQDRPIAYASRILNKTKQKYSTIGKEYLGIVWAQLNKGYC